VCAALDHFLEEAPERALETAGRVGFFWGCCGHLPEARSYLTRALELHSAPGPHRSRALWALGFTAMLSGDQDNAKWLGEQCAVAAWQAKDPEGMLSAAYLLGATYLMMGRPRAAHTLTERALAARPGAAFDSPSQLRCRFVRTYALAGLGRLEEGRREAHALRELCAERGEVWIRSYAEYELSLISLLQDRPEEAARYARAMLDSKHLIGDSYGIALGLDLLAAALAYGGSGEEAARVYGLGQACWSRVGRPQRGTPELGPVREECERRARSGIGDAAYEKAFAQGLAAHPDSTLTVTLLGPRP
jgi:tetratricopeptide (TPR) repeat protein